MVAVLNDIGTHCAVLGNHDFGKFLFLLMLLMCFYFVYCAFQSFIVKKRVSNICV